MKPDDIFLDNETNIDEKFLNITNLSVTVGGTYAINNMKMLFKVSDTPLSAIYGSKKHLDIYQILDKDYVINLILKISELTQIDQNDCIYFIKKNNYDLDKTINYIFYKKQLDVYDTKLSELKKKYNCHIFDDENSENFHLNLATFYNSYSYTKGLIELLEKKNFYNYFIIICIPDNII